ncbi:hypothetical protein OJ253_2297 [Cryptosporidium canis]|uniref:Uncharacterized protein n=1 Tax=Cryptosporidium canis TaxID=195482 RepID=A0A9D5HWT2_9CRYT|nr:hypothetical protein OJ253_2297 [Cryptosporidium canis]
MECPCWCPIIFNNINTHLSYNCDCIIVIVTNNSPVIKFTFGWKIGVTNFTEGGRMGYCGDTEIATLKINPSYGVSFGPVISAFQYNISFSLLKTSIVIFQLICILTSAVI